MDVAAIAYEFAIPLAIDGHPVLSFLTTLDRPGYVLAVPPISAHKIRAIKDLKGAVVGVTTPGSGTHNFLNYLLVRHGVALREVSITGIGIGPSAIAAFKRGQIDAGVLTGNSITTAKRIFLNLTILADTRTPEGAKNSLGTDLYPAQGPVATADWIHRNPQTAAKLARAVLQAMQWMRSHSVEEIRSRISTQYRAPDPAADSEALRAIVPGLSRDGRMTREGAEAVRRVLAVSSEKVRNAKIDLSQTYTNEFVSPTSPSQTH